MIVLLCSCGNSAADKLDAASASKALDSYYTNMVTLDDTQLEVIYGLDLSLLEEYYIKYSNENNGDFYAIIKTDSKNKNEVKSQMNNMFDVLQTQNSLYTPESVALIKNHLETSVGDYLIYLVGQDTNAIYNVVKDHIK